MNSDWHKAAAVCTGVVICVLTAMSLFYGWILLGLITGVFGMCSTASDASATFFVAFSLLIPVVSLMAGRRAYHSYGKPRQSSDGLIILTLIDRPHTGDRSQP